MIEKPRIILDMTPVLHSKGGVGRYIAGFCSGLRWVAVDEGIRFRTLDVPDAHPGVTATGLPIDLTLNTPFYLKIPYFRRIPLRTGREIQTRRQRLGKITGNPGGIFHHSGVQPVFPSGWTSVITLFDLSAFTHPEWHTSDTVAFAEKESDLIHSGSRILAISRWSANEAESWFGLPGGSVGVAGGAADHIYKPGRPDKSVLSKYGLKSGEYLLHVGSFVQRKNIPFLLEVYRNCRSAGFELPLVMVGAEKWGTTVLPADRPGLRKIDVPEDSELLHIYRGAKAVLLPSRYEGLGLPALEAMACGIPLICSNAAALADTVGEGGLLLDPEDGSEWQNAILSLTDEAYVTRLINMSLRVPRPTWNDAARRTAAFYRNLTG